MSVFVVCTAVAAAGFTAAFEVGRVCEKRLSGSSKLALPFDGFNWQSDDAKLAAKVFGALFVAENTFLPRALNPFSYVILPSSDSGVFALLAFFVFGSWTGLLALGYGAVATSLQGIQIERRAIAADREDQRQARARAEEELRTEREELAKQKRQAMASSAAVAGEWKKLHIAREEHNAHMERSENEKIWSNTIRQEFDQKTLHVVDNALDKRWREVEDQRLNLEQIRKRNKEKEQKIKEQRAQRAERASSQQGSLENEKSNLLKLAKELEDLKDNMQRLKEENIKKEQEKLKELKDREIALIKKEEDLEGLHLKKQERLREQERTLNEREERFESGEEQRKLKELSEKLESSKLNVAKFNETVMMKERQKTEEFRMRELALKQREEEISRKADIFAKASAIRSFPELEPYDSTEDMPDDEASLHSRMISQHNRVPVEEEEPDDEKKPTENKGSDDETEESTIKEESQSGEDNDFLAMDQTVDTEDKSLSIRLITERDIAVSASEKDQDSSVNDDLSKSQVTTASINDDSVPTNPSADTEGRSSETETSEEQIHSDLPTIRENGAPVVVEQEEPIEPPVTMHDVEVDDAKEEEEGGDTEEPEESSYKSLLDDEVSDDDATTLTITQNIVMDFAAALAEGGDQEFDNESSGSTCLLNVNYDYEAVGIQDALVDDDGEEKDDNSAASTNMMNSHADFEAVAMEQTTPIFPVVEEKSEQPQYYDSDDDSLFHQIQNDTAANERAAVALDVEYSSTASIGEPEEEVASPVSSPLQERSNNTVNPFSTMEKKNDETIAQSKPTSPTSNGNLSFDDAVISMIDSNTSDGSGESYGGESNEDELDEDESFEDKSFEDVASKGDSLSVGIYEKKTKIASVKHKRPSEDKVIVAEDGGVELIAWSERSVLSN